MRLPKTLASGAAVLAALTTLTGCGGSDGGGGDDGPLAGLPEGKDMASVQAFLNEHVGCIDLKMKEASDSDPEWAVKERAICRDSGGSQVTVQVISDMRKFQETHARKLAEERTKDLPSSAPRTSADIMIGNGFSVSPVSDASVQALINAGIRMQVCDPKVREEIPSGFKVDEGLVDGCFMTDYNLN
ncbi:hypothetical protein I3F58_11745 [Streptomyces sp. MUM 203J]|uniref:hypothetical protein n=1 Tax=Streptomyces sp. MUM 203J TaxID=2791990 RepID=UPI001F03C992|nr:hypothetical protein [Streptomyces sp. MUM 203J]MCH0540231.1 hypothetical protein [Streptomyces sp. MUM 203J]